MTNRMSRTHVPVVPPDAADEVDRFERFPAMLCTAGFDGEFIEVNEAPELALGYGPGELTACSFADLAHPGDWDATAAIAEEFPHASGWRCVRQGAFP